jgi:hypothetical protein
MPPRDSESHPRVDDWLDEENVEYEVEPPDEEASKAHQRHKEQVAAGALERASIDDDWYHAQPWEAYLRWRFSLRDMFAVKAIVAITLTVYRYFHSICPASVIGGLGIFFWLLMYMERLDPAVARGRHAGDVDVRSHTPGAGPGRMPPLRVSYSTADLLIAMTIASVCFALLQLFRPPLAAASLGFLVLAGIVMYWLGASPPRRAVLAWFMLTIMYLVVSAIAIIEAG